MHATSTCIALLVVCFLVDAGNVTDVPCWELYKRGVDAYLSDDYGGCVSNLESAIESYRKHAKTIQNCRLSCHQDAANTQPLYQFDVEDLLFFEKTIKNTLCLIQCKDDIEFYNIDRETVKIFESRKPYEYLHICYYQNKSPQLAASAAFTYLVSNPNDAAMVSNFKFYSDQPDIKIIEVINFEAKDYMYLYVHGTRAYDEKRWDEVIGNMEESLLSYLQSEDECRANCEGPFDPGWYPDMIPSIANHFAHSLRCKRKCKEATSTLNGEKHEDLYPSHYNFLQFAYFKRGNLRAACEAASSYLLYFPMDENMLYNIEYYRKLPKAKKEFFIPRREAMTYYHRDNYEKTLLEFVFEKFNVKTATMKKYPALSEPKPRARITQEKFISKKNCDSLLKIAMEFAVPGDGYRGNQNPHSSHEKYGGLTLRTAIKMMKEGSMNKSDVDLIVAIGDEVKQNMVEKFKVSHKLHFTYTHLVCRKAIPGGQFNRSDLSHEIHADNCNIQEDGSCPKNWPAFTWRDYTAILYLNSGFSGGELFFSSDPRGDSIQDVIVPKCGSLVSFTSGQENLHGVKAVRNGTRCALAIWFTFDKDYGEVERKQLL